MSKINKFIDMAIKYRRLKKDISDSLRSFNISYASLECLQTISNTGKVQPNKLAKMLEQEPASISRCLRELSDQKLIAYDHNVSDRRTVIVNLSTKGKNLLNSVNKKLT